MATIGESITFLCNSMLCNRSFFAEKELHDVSEVAIPMKVPFSSAISMLLSQYPYVRYSAASDSQLSLVLSLRWGDGTIIIVHYRVGKF